MDARIKSGHDERVAFAQRLFQTAMYRRHAFAISPHALREVFFYFPPSSNKGRRECRAADAPDSRVCNGSG
jgi:hypothetical protein